MKKIIFVVIMAIYACCQHQPVIAESAKAQQFRRDVRASLAHGRMEFEREKGDYPMEIDDLYRELEQAKAKNSQYAQENHILRVSIENLKDMVEEQKKIKRRYMNKFEVMEELAGRFAEALRQHVDESKLNDLTKHGLDEWDGYINKQPMRLPDEQKTP